MLLKKVYIKIQRFYFCSFVKRRAKQYGAGLFVGGRSTVTKSTTLGHNVSLNGMTIQGDGIVRIGNNFHSGQEILIITVNHNYDGGEKIPYDSTFVKKSIIIGDNVWIGSRVTILGNTTIGEGAIIQAGSVVVGDIPDCAIAGGIPAKVFKYRDKDHYYKLKKEKKFQ